MRRIDDEFSWTVDTGYPTGPRDISPYVGLRHNRAQRLLVELLELPAHPDNDYIATVGSNAGYILTGEYSRWYDPADARVLGKPASTPEEVLGAIGRAQSILGPYAALERLAGAFAIPGAQGPGFEYKLAIIYHLLGQEDNVQAELSALERIECSQDDCLKFRRFERNIKSRMAS